MQTVMLTAREAKQQRCYTCLSGASKVDVAKRSKSLFFGGDGEAVYRFTIV